MTSHRLRRYAFVAFAIVLIAPLVWVGFVMIAPTRWAKDKVVAALEARTGRSVRLERLSARWLGGIQLTDLEIGSPRTTDDPWLDSADLRLDISLLQLLRGNVSAHSLTVDGASLRVLRRVDGSLELADLILPAEPRAGRLPGHRDHAPLDFRVSNGTVTIIDLPSHTRLRMQSVEGEGSYQDQKIVIHHLRGMLNGGPFLFAGELDRSGPEPTFEARFQADDVVLDDGMTALRYAVPVLAGAPLNLKGHLDSEVYVHGHGTTWDAVSRSLVGQGKVGINPVDLDGAPLIAELSKIADLSRQGRVASVRSDFNIENRRIQTEHFTLNIGKVPMTLSGWTDFDGQIDYRINPKALTDRIPDKARRLLGDLNVELGSLASLSLRGDVNQMLVQVNGVPLDRKLLRASGLKREEREKLRVLGRQILDQLTR